MMKCPECNENFQERSVNQIYCSARCGNKYRRKHPDSIRVGDITIEFRCAKCNKLVVTDAKGDKRTRFCSRECERRYWRHPPFEHSALRNETERSLKYLEKFFD